MELHSSLNLKGLYFSEIRPCRMNSIPRLFIRYMCSVYHNSLKQKVQNRSLWMAARVLCHQRVILSLEQLSLHP